MSRDAVRPLERRFAWAASTGTALAALAAGVGAALAERPSLSVALVLAALLATIALLLRGLTVLLGARLNAAAAEAGVLRTELDALRLTSDTFRDLAYHDPLTGLANRGLLFDRVELAITRSHRQSSRVALLFLDLDDFKAVNDRFGHGFGDTVLVDLARRIRGCVRAGDTVARLGGDEFVVLLDPVGGADDAARVAAKLRESLRAPIRIDGLQARIAVSIGLSVYPDDGASAEALVRCADSAMYRDKHRDWRDRPGHVAVDPSAPADEPPRDERLVARA